MVSAMFETIADVIGSYIEAISTMFESLIAIFYVPDTGLTLLGTLVLIGAGVGIVVWGFNLIRGLADL